MQRPLTSTDTLVLKGVAILAIVLHNFYHQVGVVRENEFDFDPGRFRVFLSAVPHPTETVQAIFAYLGHFGVQVFIFLSAYGLARRYWEGPLGFDFIWRRARTIYPAFLAAISAWVLVECFRSGLDSAVALVLQHGKAMALTLCAASNLYPGLDLPPVGPWWFIPFIMQWYLLWPAMRRFSIRYGAKGLFLLGYSALACTAAMNGPLGFWRINLLETPVGHLPEFCLGIIAARYPMRIHPAAMTVAGAVFLAANLFAPLWMLGSFTALLLIIQMYWTFGGLLRRVIRPLTWIGAYSMEIFLLNGVVRLLFLDAASRKPGMVVLPIGLCSAAVSVLLGWAMQKTLAVRWPTSWRPVGRAREAS